MKIMGKSEATSDQLITYLLKNNPFAADYAGMAAIFLKEGAAEGVRGDVAFCQACKETGFFRFGGDVDPAQNNFSGLGAVGQGAKGASFQTRELGARAQIQHLKAYATKEPLVNECVDPRYSLVAKGVAPDVLDLGGRWAVPGYAPGKYSSLEQAKNAKDSYGDHIIAMVNAAAGIKITTSEKGDKMKILLISGHGAGDSGACAVIGGVTYKEADETIRMVKLIKPYLDEYADVDLYPVERNAYQDAKAGKLQVSMNDYDYILEIHFNACVKDLTGNGKTTGTECFVTTADTSTAVEEKILKNIAAFGFQNRGIKKKDYTVIHKAYSSGAESVLLEVCFIDDKDDMDIYISNLKEIAHAIANGVIEGYSLGTTTAVHTGTNSNATAAADTSFLVQIMSLDGMNVRKGPAVVYPKVTDRQGNPVTCKYGVQYTIVKTNGSWGLLKSYQEGKDGWINISQKYVKRL